jgi:hypothetical protein
LVLDRDANSHWRLHAERSKWEETMHSSEIHDYARQLLKLHGDKARVIAAQRCLESEKRGDQQEADDWRRIRDALAEMRGPHVS